ncbi:extracellular solute-binding protein [Paenibacillus montanisoli]|uniref:Sugar ABC transporter permease n=1 Tax=Paenibacillus montanisoli TaxID=2081970 RepID=A0A328TWV9_9BACL|nr:extracellular solute-binding protein [Paenibacillus montanisoli]RAP73561.1 sugar ABC transporter permease [Paenibacillus montanisoli]
MKTRKWLTILTCTVLLAGLVSACSKDNNTTSNEASNNANESNAANTSQADATNAANAPAEETLAGSLITKDPLQLTIHMHYGNRWAFDDNWSVFKEAAKLTNVSLHGTTPTTGTDSYEMANLMLASGELPDIIHGFHDWMRQQGPEGVLIDLKDLIDQYAPNIKKMMDADPGIEKYALASDGKMYFIPSVVPQDNIVAKGWMIRQDWLDKLQLPVPQTYQDYYNTLKAFKEKDPNGNGKADEVPYMSRNTSGVQDLLIFWDADYGWKLRDGKVAWGPSEQQFKDALTNIAKWYKEGLIDKEIFTRGPQAREELFGANVGGSTHDFMQSSTKFNETLAEQVPGFKMQPIAPPANVSGQHVEETKNSTYLLHGWGISSKSEHPVEAIKYFDFWYGKEGEQLANYGVKDETYTADASGNIDLTPKVKEGNLLENLNLVGAQLEYPHTVDPTFSRFQNTPIVNEAFKMYTEGNYPREQFPVLSYLEDEQKRYDEILGAINTYVNEMFQKWVMGNQPVDDKTFDAFVGKMKEMGLDEMVQIQQAAYDRYVK